MLKRELIGPVTLLFNKYGIEKTVICILCCVSFVMQFSAWKKPKKQGEKERLQNSLLEGLRETQIIYFGLQSPCLVWLMVTNSQGILPLLPASIYPRASFSAVSFFVCLFFIPFIYYMPGFLLSLCFSPVCLSSFCSGSAMHLKICF